MQSESNADSTSLDEVKLTDNELNQLQDYFQYSAYRDAINDAITAVEQSSVIKPELSTDTNLAPVLEHKSDSESDSKVLTGDDLTQFLGAIAYIRDREEAYDATVKQLAVLE